MLTRQLSPSPPARSSAASDRLSSYLAALILAVAVMLAYSGSLNAPFVYDDALAIPENQTIRKLWPLTDILWPQAEGGLTVSGRPVLNLSFAINYAISGANTWSYHVFNILVHIGSALLLLGIMRRTIERRSALFPGDFRRGRLSPDQRFGSTALHLGFAVAAMWALHPLLTQAVTYTVQRAESLMGFFYLLTLYAFVRGVDYSPPNSASMQHRRRTWLGVSIGACVLGMATKEVMATAPIMVFLYDRTFGAGSFRAAWRARRSYHLTLAATWLILATLVLSTGGNRGGTVGIGTGVPLWAYPMTQFEAIGRYLALAVWPRPLVFEYGTFWVKRAGDLLPFAVLIVPLLAGTVVALRRWPAWGFAGCWFFLILAPTSLAPGTIQMIVEHRMYLPLIAVVAAAVLGTHHWLGHRAVVVAAAAAIALGLLTYRRNNDYRSHLAIWTDTVTKRPQNPRAHDGLAEAFAELGRVDDALTHRREAVRLLPDESRYHYNLAMTLSAAGKREEAIHYYQSSLRLTPDEARTHNNLAILFGEMRDNNAALSHYAEAVRLKPNDALYHYNHGVALLRAGRHMDAAASFETVLGLQRDHPDAHFNLATTLVRLSRIPDALSHYREALRLKPEDADYRITFGGALLLANRPDEALVEFERALAARPDAIEAMFGTGNALAALRRFDEAVARYQTVLRRAPDHAGAHFKLGNTFLDLDRVSNAVEHYSAAAQLLPDDAETHHNLGVAYARLERWSEAQREFESALRLKPDYSAARRNLEQLKAMLGR